MSEVEFARGWDELDMWESCRGLEFSTYGGKARCGMSVLAIRRFGETVAYDFHEDWTIH
jgi:hypothetical protein